MIPFFRADATIGRALGSVAAQTWPVSEVIVVDDASGPESAALLTGLAVRWPSLSLRLVTLEVNSGAAGARNAGWAQAQGEFIAFLDADDAWHPRKVEVQLAYMQTNPEVDACGHGHTVAPATQARDGARAGAAMPVQPASINRIGRIGMLLRNPFVTPSVMVRRRVTLRFEPGQRHMEDHRLWMRMVLAGLHVEKLDVSLVTLFKASIGAGGLSGDVLKMQAGDFGNYIALYREGLLGLLETTALLCWSLAKFVRRILLLSIRRMASGARPS